jgi:hypothetical protein
VLGPTREFVGPVGLEPTTYGLQIWLFSMSSMTRHDLPYFASIKGKSPARWWLDLINLWQGSAAFLVPKLCLIAIAFEGG